MEKHLYLFFSFLERMLGLYTVLGVIISPDPLLQKPHSATHSSCKLPAFSCPCNQASCDNNCSVTSARYYKSICYICCDRRTRSWDSYSTSRNTQWSSRAVRVGEATQSAYGWRDIPRRENLTSGNPGSQSRNPLWSRILFWYCKQKSSVFLFIPQRGNV